jgi:uncharacterized protein YdiU (UPF0061 family)
VNTIFNFTNSYQQLGKDFFDNTLPNVVKNPQLLVKNHELLKNLSLENIKDDELTHYLSGNKLIQPAISTVYAGHQFGHFNPQLGDGRAALLGEIQTQDAIFDIQLKGCGQTKYSRSGDGKLALGPAIREYLVSEAMFYLGVKTTRCLSIVMSDDVVLREKPLRGSVLTRVLESNVRVGTFEYFAAKGDVDNVRKLADYCINRNYPQVNDSKNKYLEFFKQVAKNQATQVAHYMGLGFIHGVLNTDNTTITGEVIDYGPCAFMDEFNSNTVFSSIDAHGRYAYNNQANIVAWNLSSLGYCLSSLFANPKEEIQAVLQDFQVEFDNKYNQIIAHKLGFEFKQGDEALINELLQLLQKYSPDWTSFFINLVDGEYPNYPDFKAWFDKWQYRKDQNYHSIMQYTNPVVIPRNHQIERIISEAYNENFESFFEFNEILKQPFIRTEKNQKYTIPPTEYEKVQHTFCGT